MAVQQLQRQQPMYPPNKEFRKSDTDITIKSANSSPRPTPSDFGRFIPWLMLEMQHNPVRIQKAGPEKRQLPMTNEVKKLLTEACDEAPLSCSSISEFNKVFIESEPKNAIRITTYYDSEGHLMEISFIEHPEVPIHRQVLKAIALCLPFHPTLTKISIRREKLDSGIVYEISKLLPFSKLTEIDLDHCHVLQGNFYILLDQQTTLKCLSLSDCNIDDLVCKEIADRIEDICPASKNLRVLNLSSNRITDVGAEALGCSLRTNRILVYLNLCNNGLTSVGAAHLLLPLSEFRFTIEELLKYKDKRYSYIKKKLQDAERPLKDISVNVIVDGVEDRPGRRRRDMTPVKTGFLRKRSTPKSSWGSKGSVVLNVINEMALDVTAQSNDAFHPANMFQRRGSLFSVGNFVLCCLNIGYNRLDFSSVEKLVEVLSYQQQHKIGDRCGLLRVVIEGNKLPVSSPHYDLISKYFEMSVKNKVSSPLKKTHNLATQTREKRKQKIFEFIQEV